MTQKHVHTNTKHTYKQTDSEVHTSKGGAKLALRESNASGGWWSGRARLVLRDSSAGAEDWSALVLTCWVNTRRGLGSVWVCVCVRMCLASHLFACVCACVDTCVVHVRMLCVPVVA
jgi:hypothetical protein